MKLFDAVPIKRLRKNKFDLSHERKLTTNMGRLTPVLCVDTLPGDRFRISSQVFLRFLALLSPVMHRVDVTVHYFKVPYRLLWPNWAGSGNYQSFITGGEQGGLALSMPTFNINNVHSGIGDAALKESSLLDYLGFPVVKASDTVDTADYGTQQFNALWPKAYQLIYDQYYRDQWVETTNITSTFFGDGLMSVADTTVAMTLRLRMWNKDYLTSALPNTQRGAPVTIPVVVTASTTGDGGTNHAFWRAGSTGNSIPGNEFIGSAASGGTSQYGLTANISAVGSQYGFAPVGGAYYDPNGTLTSTSITVNSLRQSVRLQEWLEKNARGGGRYIEAIAMHFGVESSDARLQRVEYLGGGKAPVIVSEVLQTGPAVTAGANTPLGTMGGHALSVGNTNQCVTYCEEHCVIMGIMSVMPKTAYQQAMPLTPWRKFANTDYFWPSFAHLGEQAVLNFEAYTNIADAAAFPGMFSTFGYQSRYAEYKYIPDTVHGSFRSTLNYWHWGRVFPAQPNLNLAFLQCVPSLTPFATVGLTDYLVAQVYNKVDALRPIPYFSEPRL